MTMISFFSPELLGAHAARKPSSAAVRYVLRWLRVGRCRSGRAAEAGLRPRLIAMLAWVLTTGLLGWLAFPAHALDANTASVVQLETLNGVGPRTAQIIVQERERAGPFESLEDLSDRVRGIGRKRLARLRAAGLSVGAGVTVFSPNTIASPQFAPALPPATPLPAATPLPVATPLVAP